MEFPKKLPFGQATQMSHCYHLTNMKLLTDTIYIKIKDRPEIKNLDIYFEPPSYTNIDKITHIQSIEKI